MSTWRPSRAACSTPRRPCVRRSFTEFAETIEGRLQLTLNAERPLHDLAMMAVWLALDHDGSGSITVGEFGAFMRRGEHALHPGKTWKERRVILSTNHIEWHLPRARSLAKMKRTNTQYPWAM